MKHHVPIEFLLVEDNPDHVDLVKESFSTCRLANTLTVAESGEEALSLLTNPDRPRPDVVLLDLNLPGISGLEVLERIKGDPALCMIPVVVLTTSSARSDRQKVYALHANSYVAKPVDFERMQEIVEQLELYWTICNQPPE